MQKPCVCDGLWENQKLCVLQRFLVQIGSIGSKTMCFSDGSRCRFAKRFPPLPLTKKFLVPQFPQPCVFVMILAEDLRKLLFSESFRLSSGKTFFEEREGQEPQGIPPKNWMNLLLSAEPPRHSHPRFLDSSHKILRSLLGDSRRFLWDLLLKTRWIGWLLFVGHPNRVSCLKNWMLCVAWRLAGVLRHLMLLSFLQKVFGVLQTLMF